MRLRRLVEFAREGQVSLPPGIALGRGVTAVDRRDALRQITKKIFHEGIVPQVLLGKEDVGVSQLDTNRVLPNMGQVTHRGIWFRPGHD